MLSGSTAASDAASSLRPDQLLERFLTASPRQRRTLLRCLDERAAELVPLLSDRLVRVDTPTDDWAPASLLQMLVAGVKEEERDAIVDHHASRFLRTESRVGIDYVPLQRLLIRQEFEAADRLTSSLLRQLAGPAAETRGYVYYSEVDGMPDPDLDSLDRLWVAYSRGRFGFSVQGRLLQACGGQWERLWARLGWKRNGVWTRYPLSFTWSMDAPEGHMPLINQLRGVRLMDALLRHPALVRRIEAG